MKRLAALALLAVLTTGCGDNGPSREAVAASASASARAAFRGQVISAFTSTKATIDARRGGPGGAANALDSFVAAVAALDAPDGLEVAHQSIVTLAREIGGLFRQIANAPLTCVNSFSGERTVGCADQIQTRQQLNPDARVPSLVKLVESLPES